MKKIFCLWILCASLIFSQSIYFLPSENKEALDALISAFKSAQSDIKVSIYTFTHRQIANALRDSASRGVKVQVIYDKSQNLGKNHSTIGYLVKYKNIEVCTLEGLKSGEITGIMHQKMAIIDNSTLIIGSANYSKQAFERSYELLYITKESDVLTKAIQNFNTMQKACMPFNLPSNKSK